MRVMVFILATSMRTVSFSTYDSVLLSSLGHAMASVLPLRNLLWKPPTEYDTQSAARRRSAP